MKLAVLTRNPGNYSTRRVLEVAKARGHDARAIDYTRCFMEVAARPAHLIMAGAPLELDAVVPRVGVSYPFYGTAIVRQLEMAGVATINGSIAIARARDKLQCLQLLARADIPLPTTGFAHSILDIDGLIDQVGGAPLVVKLIEGTQGVGVVLAETRKAAQSVIEAFRQLDANILVQEFIAEAGGGDIRAFVVGGRVLAGMKRQGAPGEFRANLHRGGTAEMITLTDEEEEIAIKSAATLGLGMAGVDLLRSNRGPLVLEVNASPGLEGIEAASGLDLAAEIVGFLEGAVEAGRRE